MTVRCTFSRKAFGRTLGCRMDVGQCSTPHEHEPVFQEFNSLKDAEAFFYSAKYDAEFSKPAGSKERKTTKEEYSYYKCSRDKMSKDYQTKKPITKKDKYCYAHLIIKGNEDHAVLYGCLRDE